MFIGDEAFFSSVANNPDVQLVLRAGNQPSTREAYARGWKKWLKFLSTKGLERNEFLIDIPEKKKRDVVFEFLVYLLRIERASEGVIRTIWCGVVDRFTEQCVNTTTVFESRAAVKARRGAMNLAKTCNPVQKRLKRLPATEDMFEFAREDDWEKGSIEIQMVNLAVRTGFEYGARVSEYAHVSKESPHTILAERVIFHTLIGGALEEVPAPRVRERNLEPGQVVAAVFNWPTTKTTSKSGPLVRSSPYHSLLLDDLVSWSLCAGLIDGVPFFSRLQGGLRKTLDKKEVNNYIKLLATRYLASPIGFSSHSLRVGQSSNMSSQGASDAVINQRLGWATGSSTGRKVYIRPSPHIHGPGSALSIDDTKVLQRLSLSHQPLQSA